MKTAIQHISASRAAICAGLFIVSGMAVASEKFTSSDVNSAMKTRHEVRNAPAPHARAVLFENDEWLIDREHVEPPPESGSRPVPPPDPFAQPVPRRGEFQFISRNLGSRVATRAEEIDYRVRRTMFGERLSDNVDFLSGSRPGLRFKWAFR